MLNILKTCTRWTWSKIEGSIKWVASITSESTGEGSASRVALLMVSGAVVILLVGHLLYLHRIPSHDELTGVAEIIAATGTAYGANKVAKVIGGKKDDSQQ